MPAPKTAVCPLIIWLADDGLVPNNATLPLILYAGAFDPRGADPQSLIRSHFAGNGWGNAWVNGIYPFHHYHATVHEVLGLASGAARVQLGGEKGPVRELVAGDAVFIPAGVGHCRLDSRPGLVVIGAYPGGADWDLRRATPAERLLSLPLIARVPPPPFDPVLGDGGPACCGHRP